VLAFLVSSALCATCMFLSILPPLVDLPKWDAPEVMETLSRKFSEEPITNTITQETRWFQTIKIPLLSSDSESRQVIGICSDITEGR